MKQEDLDKILQKKGYGITSSFPKSSFKSSLKSHFKREKTLNQAGGEGTVPIMERSAGLKSVRPKDFAVPDSGRCVVRVKVYRRRLTDTGNDCWKYHLDACRYLGWLQDDDDATIRLEEEPHEKVESNEEERVEITLEYDGIDINDLINHYKDGPRNQ